MPNTTIPMISPWTGDPLRRFPAITDSSQFSYPWRDDPSIPSHYPWWWGLVPFPDMQSALARMTGFNASPFARAKILENSSGYTSGAMYRDWPYIVNAATPYEYDIRTREGQYLATHPVYQNPNWRQAEEQAAAYAENQRNPGLGYFNLGQALLFAAGAGRAGAQGIKATNANAAAFEAMRANPAYQAQVRANQTPATINDARVQLRSLVRPNVPRGTTPTNAQLLNPANLINTRFLPQQVAVDPVIGRTNADPAQLLLPFDVRWRMTMPPEVQPTAAAIDQARANLRSLLPENAVEPAALPAWSQARFRERPLLREPVLPVATAKPTKEPQPGEPVNGAVTVKGVKYNSVEEAKAAILAEMRKGSKQEQANAGNPAYTTKLEEGLRTMAGEQYIATNAANKPTIGQRINNWWSTLTGAPRKTGLGLTDLIVGPDKGGAPINPERARYDNRYNQERVWRTGAAGMSTQSRTFPGSSALAGLSAALFAGQPAAASSAETADLSKLFDKNFVNPFASTEEKDKQSLTDREKAAADALAQQSAGGSGGTGVAGGSGAGGGMMSINDINAAFNKAMDALTEMQRKNQVERDAAKVDMDNYGGQLDNLVNTPLAEVAKQQEINPDASFMSSLAANIAAVLNPNINALGQRSQYVAEQNAKYGREHDELVRKHEDMKSERLFKYQALADKFRRAADIYDKRGDSDRAMEMIAKHDDMLKRLDAIMAQQSKAADRQVQREEIASRKYATNVTNKDKQYLQMVNNLEQVAANYEKMAENEPKQTMKRQYAMLARQNRLKLQDIQEQGIAAGGDISQIRPNPFYPHEQAMKRFRSLNPAVADSAGFEREFRRTQGFSNDKDFTSTWGIPRGEFRLWALKQLAGVPH